MRYTPEQLTARGLAESDLTLYWFDATETVTQTDGTVIEGAWETIPIAVDPACAALASLPTEVAKFCVACALTPTAVEPSAVASAL